MRCLSCHLFSRSVICPACRERLLVPTHSRRTIGTLEVVSLFKYTTLETFLLTKHTPEGHRIYRYLGSEFVAPFLEHFADNMGEGIVSVIGVDEHVRHGYAHIALLTHAVLHPRLNPLHGKLLARQRTQYAGKTLQYRLEHPRRFVYTGPHGIQAILVDDIVTTGVTLQEAQQTLQRAGVDVLFAVALADAQG